MMGMYWYVLAELKKIAKYKIGMYCIVLACIVQYTPLYIQIPVNTYQNVPNTYQFLPIHRSDRNKDAVPS